MQKEHLIAIAGGALLFLLGLVIGISAAGPDTEEIEAAVAGRIDAATAAQADRIGKLEESVAALGEPPRRARRQRRRRHQGGRRRGGQARRHALGPRPVAGGAIETSKSASLAALESGLAGLRGQIAAAPAAAPAEEAAAPAGAAAPDAGHGPAGHLPRRRRRSFRTARSASFSRASTTRRAPRASGPTAPT